MAWPPGAGWRVGAPLEGDIRAALEKAGFDEKFFGESQPPVTHYELSKDDAGFYAEFLTPLVGSGQKRDGTQDATVSVAGVTAQKLRHLEILFVDPWVIRIGPNRGCNMVSSADCMGVNASPPRNCQAMIHGKEGKKMIVR